MHNYLCRLLLRSLFDLVHLLLAHLLEYIGTKTAYSKPVAKEPYSFLAATRASLVVAIFTVTDAVPLDV